MSRNMTYEQAKEEDFEKLLELRIRAMRPSLERIGRFDPLRARNRFRNSFLPEQTTLIKEEDRLLGFYMVSEGEELFLNHLYIDPSCQASGLGSLIMGRIQERASREGKSIRLEALKESRANRFYLSRGFIKVDEGEFDNIYLWKAPAEKESSRPF